MHRFFTDEPLVISPEKEYYLCGSDAYHIINVLRKKQGDEISVCDTEGCAFLCTVSNLFPSKTTDEARVSFIVRSLIGLSENAGKRQKILCQAFTKSDKMDLIVQKATELGADRIIPVYMKRCVSLPDEKGVQHKLERWRRIAYEASKQSHRTSVPDISEPYDFSSLIDEMSGNCVFFCCHEDAVLSLKEYMSALGNKNTDGPPSSPVTPISFLIGPEGGYDAEETDILLSKKIPLISLGSNILRTETAPIATLSMLIYEEM